MPTQSELIGNHPISPSIFDNWLTCDDVVVTANKCHRSLSGKSAKLDDDLVDWAARKLIEYHYSDKVLARLKARLGELGFKEYAVKHRQLPIADRTRKGNATEVILTEYIEACLNKSLVKAYRLRYNPNVDQSMKGDDVLIADLITENNIERLKLYLGEAKFRKVPDKTVIEEIVKSLSKDKLPLSYSFLINDLERNNETELSEKLDNYVLSEIRGFGDLVYAGVLLSNTNTHHKVESDLNSENPNMVFISIGIENPHEFIDAAYAKAEDFLNNPQLL